MNTNTLKLLADAISDIGSWQWWYTKDDMFQLEFSDVLLYDETTQEKESIQKKRLTLRLSAGGITGGIIGA